MSALDAPDIWAVGQKSYQPGPGYHALTVKWDGTRWVKYQSRSPGHGRGTSVLGVGMATSASGFAVGYYETPTSFKPFIEQWTGERWIRERLGPAAK